MKANCPSCGAEVQFKSSISVFSVCDYCKSMIVRRDMDLESLGKMARLPDDVSPLQLGSRGKYRDAAFEVIGRLKVAWSDGYWNEWFLLFENGKNGWLAEAMGFFIMSAEIKATDRVPGLADIAVGRSYELAPSSRFFVDDIKEAVCIGSEGELPFKGLQGRKTVSVDLSNYGGEFVNIEYSGQDDIRLYVGRYVEFGELAFSNLRDLTADMKKIRSATAFKCPSCGGPFSLLTPGLTALVACRYCGSTIDTTNQTLALLSKAEKQIKIKPLITIGQRGKLFGAEWEVTGFMCRSDASGVYTWDEYLLFNPYQGFRWLTTYNGHWNFVELMRISPVREIPGMGTVKFKDKTFKKFLIGKGKVVYVLGEFYWRVKIGETVDVADFICPPEILSCESDKSEVNWSVGKYIEPGEVAQAFGVQSDMPRKEGVAPNQFNPYGSMAQAVTMAFMVFVAVLTVLQFYFILAAPGKEVYRGNFSFDDRKRAQPFVTPAFDIPGAADNLAVKMESPLMNDWMEASVDLVDENSGRHYEFEQGVEYYAGTDSDGSWTEGNRQAGLVLSSVPGGRYHLVIQPSGSGVAAQKDFTISLRRGVAIWSNFFIAFLLLAIYPVCVCMKSRGFEARRWAESDTSPATADTNEGE